MDSNPFAFFFVLPGTKIRIIAIGEMTEDNRIFTETHRRDLTRFQPYDIDVNMARKKTAVGISRITGISIIGTFPTTCPLSQATSESHVNS